MIRKVTIYEVGGVRFDTIEEAEKYSALCEKVGAIMSRIAPRTPELEKGEDVVFHDKNVVAEVLDDFAELVTERLPSGFRPFEDKRGIYRLPEESISVLMQTNAEGRCLAKAFYRLCCIVPQIGLETQTPKQAKLIIDALKKGEVL